MSLFIHASLQPFIVMVAIIAATLSGLWLLFFRRLRPRAVATVVSFGLTLAPLGMLLWNTGVMITCDTFGWDSGYVPKISDFDNPMIVFAAIYAGFHTIADMIRSIERDEIRPS